ncbi:peptidoglycan-binding protein [Pseudaestuariivita rosea]|uniref:peptidoglycan-binding domain-containing protein n=1 Tax=Pseudaestuariivita rosea TaxID=2763263 RepID=UPI001ABB25B4|nr:peptidoglycan-binding protein [Pseudaestuariivita rosea]
MKLFYAFLLTVIATPAVSDIALVIGNRSYDEAPRVSDASRVRDTVAILQEDGFQVFDGRDMTAEQMQNLAGEWLTEVNEGSPDRIFVLLAGHVVMRDDRPYLLGVAADELSAFSLGRDALPITPLLRVMSDNPGRAVFMLSPSDDAPTGPGLVGAYQGIEDVPQGIAIADGDMRGLNSVLETLLEGRSYRDMAVTSPRGVSFRGFLGSSGNFSGAEQSDGDATGSVEQGYWRAIQDLDTQDGYRAYLRAYPRGQYADDANRQIIALRDEPERAARETEDDLELSRDDRRQIQRDLTLLEYNTRGIDGIFGPGTRGALTAWQRENGYEDTGFISRPQIVALREQARARAAVLEEEARVRREEQEREDRAYWQETGDSGDEEDLRAYLERYPDGLFSDEAKEQLEEYEAEKRATAEVAEREFWDEVKERNTIDAYRDYLRRYPDGLFVPAAQAAITELEQGSRNEAEVDRAWQEERNIVRGQIARLLAEQALAANGTDPGRIDGEFTDKTRRAIRDFQRNRNLPVTGYISQDTAVQLLGGR